MAGVVFGGVALHAVTDGERPTELQRRSAGWNYDGGFSPEEFVALMEKTPLRRPPLGSWLRVRGMEHSAVLRDGAQTALYTTAPQVPSVSARRNALATIARAGYQTVAILRWDVDTWSKGIRGGLPIRRLPIDLTEAFERCRLLAATYGDLIDYWEIDNEPDISFVEENPETYAAFLKACALGIRRGSSENRFRPVTFVSAAGKLETQNSKPETATRASRVLMAPMALPPGPYFEAFVQNGGLGYTDGFNYHYYGYAEDFTGAYRQFEAAVRELGGGAGGRQATEYRGQLMGGSRQATGDSGQAAEGSAKNGAVTGDSNRRAAGDTRRRGSDFELRADGTRPTLHVRTGSSVFTTRFFPNWSGWSGAVAGHFNHALADAEEELVRLLERPLAAEEPAMRRDGRWLVSPDVRVEETADAWRFTVEQLPDRPRTIIAELPLPAGWNAEPDALLNLEYRFVPTQAQSGGQKTEDDGGQTKRLGVYDPARAGGELGRNDVPPRPRENPELRTQNSELHRSLPVFLTEYGYGRLDKQSRTTAEGRERQRGFFRSTSEQIRTLGIEGAMAFYLPPYLENDSSEFGLLMDEFSGPAVVRGQPKADDAQRMTDGGERNADDRHAGARWENYTVSPALAQLLADGERPLEPRRWPVTEANGSAIVIDFVAGDGLRQAKSYGGYLLDGEFGRTRPAKGVLVIYNFGIEAASGTLSLTGKAWSLADARRELRLTIGAGEQKRVPVHVFPEASEFTPFVAAARFVSGATSDAPGTGPSNEAVPPGREADAVTSTVPPQVAAPVRPRDQTPEIEQLEVKFRTGNGNLYQTWPRLQAISEWQRYLERIDSFTPSFYGRHNLPWRFSDNRPVSLVFVFHPKKTPVTFEIRKAMVVKFVGPGPAK